MNRELRSGQDKRNSRPRDRVRARQKKIRDRDTPSHRPGKGRDRGEAETQRHSPRGTTQETERPSWGGGGCRGDTKRLEKDTERQRQKHRELTQTKSQRCEMRVLHSDRKKEQAEETFRSIPGPAFQGS